ncbi:MAG: hypothetical protein P4N41_19940 [Negativicutes bacterium]|nr:hypothetical protein [Negativicutes bacterium]MDR3591933.1 hypothetical protein [Negativicutes bacterium]
MMPEDEKLQSGEKGAVRMTGQDMQRVKQFLYSIRTTEFAIANLERAILDIDTRRQSPPDWTRHPEAVRVSGGKNEPVLEAWVEFLDTYDARRSFLEDSLAQQRRKVEQYNDTLALMAEEPNWGCLGAQIVEYKFRRRVKPDSAVYALHLFCGRETFYRGLKKALRFFCEALPDRFG